MAEKISQKKDTDACTLFPEGDWSDCCAKHDEAYRIGGNSFAREVADYNLFCCVFDGGRPVLALIMYWGCRLFGGPFWPHRYRWGRDYQWSKSFTYVKSSDQFFERLAQDLSKDSDYTALIEKIKTQTPDFDRRA